MFDFWVEIKAIIRFVENTFNDLNSIGSDNITIGTHNHGNVIHDMQWSFRTLHLA